jgi:outer membrane protein assembly factor BamA
VRGYPEEGLLPADQTNPEDPSSPCVPETDREGEERCISLGGNAYINIKAELRTPLVPGTVEGALFVDAGNLWLDPANFDPFELRPAAGFGLRFVTPIGPVAFDFGFNLDPDEDRREPLWNLHFNIGMF